MFTQVSDVKPIRHRNIVKTGFILSTVSGVLIILQGALHIIRAQWGLELGLGELRRHSLMELILKSWASSIVLGVMVLFGAFLIRTPGREREGGITSSRFLP